MKECENRIKTLKPLLIKNITSYRNGWWVGWDEFEENINYYLFEGEKTDVRELKEIMQCLKKEGMVLSQPIFGEDGMLNGKGWFLTKG